MNHAGTTLQVIDEALGRSRTSTAAVGTVVSVEADRINATVVFDPATLAVPVLVGGTLDVTPGDRVVLNYYGPPRLGTWVISTVTSRRVGNLLFVQSTAAGTGTGGTEIKDASGDLPLVALTGEVYRFAYKASAIAGAASHVIDVNLRDSGDATSPTNTDTVLDSTTRQLSGSTNIREMVIIDAVLRCPDDIAAGTHVVAVFYVRNANGAVTNNVQLENAGPRRRLSVTRVCSPLAPES